MDKGSDLHHASAQGTMVREERPPRGLFVAALCQDALSEYRMRRLLRLRMSAFRKPGHLSPTLTCTSSMASESPLPASPPHSALLLSGSAEPSLAHTPSSLLLARLFAPLGRGTGGD
ncbi:hypothetical protein SKAU_G00391580 [Synaphobranchus kaupii]|uniref:Uncharacterized protein n=1 Tax=Synaphobranchus kaupii TaxID=118154 RepID=A0A9Q1EBP5_SYNKA|nr:hypothetical protein SKAU_G00391580 [Synaphobranchus kaupii]